MNPNMQRELSSYVLLIAFFYVNIHILIPRFYFTSRYFIFGAFTLLAFLVTALAPFAAFKEDLSRHLGPRPEEGSILFEFGHNFFQFSVVTFFSLALSFSNRWKQTERARLNTELAYLRAQINPHFLFNSLNSIYSLALQKSELTAPAVVKLSAMMRYVVSESNRDFVSLEKELTYIRNYIELQKIRFGDTIQLSFTAHGTFDSKQIAPLILIVFVENAFKHGVNAEEISMIRIDIQMEGDDLKVEVFNHKVVTRKLENDRSGLGIENARNRLRLLYPNRHGLEIKETQADFLVMLTLQLR